MPEQPKHVIVVGGGIIGLASAHFLMNSGVQVTVIEKDRIGAACSHGNCGLICPSHVMPLPGPGAFSKAFKAIVKSNAPFRIKPQWNWSFWKWFLAFGLNCSSKQFLATSHARHALLTYSREFYHQLIVDQQMDCDFEERGCLFVYGSQKTLDAYDQTDRLFRQELGLVAEKLNAHELEKMEPAFIPGVAAGAWYYPQDAHLRPDKLISAWKSRLIEQGVVFHERCELIDLKASTPSKQATQALVNHLDQPQAEPEELTADGFIIAIGSWTPWLNQLFGAQIPIQPGKGYSITMTRPQAPPSYPMILEDEKVAITPLASGYRIGSTMEFVGYDTSIKERRLDLLRNGARKYMRDPFGDEVQENWYGWRPMTPDGRPFIDLSPRFENVVIAAGHNMIGLMSAPATGKLAAELVTRQNPFLDPTPYRISGRC